MVELKDLPQDVMAEVGVLGALLVESEIAEEVVQKLKKEHFSIPAHQLIYESITQLYDANKPFDLVVVQEQLKQKGRLADAGGAAYLLSLIEAVPSAGNVEEYARIVREKSILRQLIQASGEISFLAKKAEQATEEILDKSEKLIFEITQKETANEPAHIYDLLLVLFRQIEESRTGLSKGTPSGFPDLDGLISGLQDSTLNIIAARPSMGKTSFVLNIVDHIGINLHEAVLIFSLEMSKEQLVQNMVCSRVQISPHRLKGTAIDHEDYVKLTRQAGVFCEAPVFIDDTPAISIRELRAKARRFKARHNIRLIVIDYLQLMQASEGGRSEGRQQEISQISRSLKEIARELQVPVIALSQLNRSVDARDDHRPRMSDLRESGALEQDADTIMFLYRDEYYNKETDEPGIAEVIVAKNRTGPTGHVKLRFIKEFMKFIGLSYQKP